MTYYLTSDGIPFQLTRMAIGSMRCRIPVVPGGDGAETVPLDERTGKCPHRAYVLIGSGPVCGHHVQAFFRVAGERLRESVPPCPV